MKLGALLAIVYLLCAATVAIVGAVSRARAVRDEVIVVVHREGTVAANESELAPKLEAAVLGRPGLVRTRTETTTRGVRLGLTFQEHDDEALRRHLAEVRSVVPPDATVEWRAPSTIAWVFAPTPITAALATVSGVASVEDCGRPLPDRIVVKMDDDRRKAADVPFAALLDVPWRSLPIDVAELRSLFVFENVRLADIADVAVQSHPPACGAWLANGERTIAHAVRLRPGADRAVLRAVVAKEHALLLEPERTIHTRFYTSRFHDRERPFRESTVRRFLAEATARAPIIAVAVDELGTGATFLPAPARPNDIEGRYQPTGGVKGAPRLEIVLHSRPPLWVPSRASDIEKLLDVPVETRTGPSPEVMKTVRVFESIARESGLDVAKLLAYGQFRVDDDNESAPLVITDLPSVAALEEVWDWVLPRAVRIDGHPVTEFAIDVSRGDALGRAQSVRQALGESPDVSLRLGVGFSDFSTL